MKQLVIAKVFGFITGEPLIGEAWVFVLLRIVKLLNMILKWWIDDIIYLLPIKCIYGTLQPSQLLNRALIHKIFKIYLHGQGIAGWVAVLTCEHKYIINE